jgi:hypothetical protein
MEIGLTYEEMTEYLIDLGEPYLTAKQWAFVNNILGKKRISHAQADWLVALVDKVVAARQEELYPEPQGAVERTEGNVIYLRQAGAAR